MRFVSAMLIAAFVGSHARAAGNPADGQRDFTRCSGCHATQPGKNGIGPSLDGVVCGRRRPAGID